MTKKNSEEAIKKQKKQSREAIAGQITLLLGKYKNGVGKKKYEKSLKKASKVLSKVVVVPVTKNIKGKKTATKTTTPAK